MDSAQDAARCIQVRHCLLPNRDSSAARKRTPLFAIRKEGWAPTCPFAGAAHLVERLYEARCRTVSSARVAGGSEHLYGWAAARTREQGTAFYPAVRGQSLCSLFLHCVTA